MLFDIAFHQRIACCMHYHAPLRNGWHDMKCNNCGKNVNDAKGNETTLVIDNEYSLARRITFCFDCCLNASFSMAEGIMAMIEKSASEQFE